MTLCIHNNSEHEMRGIVNDMCVSESWVKFIAELTMCVCVCNDGVCSKTNTCVQKRRKNNSKLVCM